MSNANDHVVLVDADDREVGTLDKWQAHQQGLLHRAFSVFVLDGAGRLLLQQRALGKYHSGGLWTNTCCSHPRPGETVRAAAVRRLREELGLECDLEEVFQFTYHAEVGNGLIEHELDHVLIGRCTDAPAPDPDEVMDTRWQPLNELDDELRLHPERFTAWFRICWNEAYTHLRERV